MELGHGQPISRATIEGGKPLTKDKVVKIRMDAVELLELDALGKKFGFAERATTIRKLMEMAKDLEQANRIVLAFRESREKQAQFESLMQDRGNHA